MWSEPLFLDSRQAPPSKGDANGLTEACPRTLRQLIQKEVLCHVPQLSCFLFGALSDYSGELRIPSILVSEWFLWIE